MKSFKVDKEITTTVSGIIETKTYPKNKDGLYWVYDGISYFLVSVVQDTAPHAEGTDPRPPMINMLGVPRTTEVKEYYEVKHTEMTDLHKSMLDLKKQVKELGQNQDREVTMHPPVDVVSIETMLKTVAIATNKKAAKKILGREIY